MALRSKSTAYILGLLCEGPIEGPAIESDWEKSTYLQETQLKNSDNTYNFDGAHVVATSGTTNQWLNDFNGGDKTEAETIVNVKITNAGGATSRSITDDDVDHCRVTFSLPQGLLAAYDSGKQGDLSVGIKITVTPNGGSEQTAYDTAIQGRTFSEYRKQYLVSNLKSFGAAPWTIKVYRTNADRTSSSEASYRDELYWYSYSEIKEVKLMYMNRVVVGTTLVAEDFGDNIPNRAYKIKGLKISYPDNYTPSTRSYAGTWGGTFTTGYCNNPAWVLYDMITNTRYGLGLPDWQVDKWQLYSIAKYCDETVTYTEAQLQTDGTYSDVDVDQPRFTFNGVVAEREKALVVINHLASVFRGFPLWSNGLVSFLQDCPQGTSRVATPANVVDGMFEYEGTPKTLRHTACKVTWNNPEYFGKQDTVVIEDRDGIKKYGYNPLDVFAVGCTNRNEAILRAKYILYTDINQTEVVKFKGGIDWADCFPGEVIAVQDPDYAGAILSGRIVSTSANSITIDYPITLPAGNNYVFYQRDQTLTYSNLLSNSPGSNITVLTSASGIEGPVQNGNVWLVRTETVAPRYFRVLAIRETEKYQFEIVAYEYDPNKYSFVEDGVYVEPQPPTTLLTGALAAPSNFTAEAISYTNGATKNREYGVLLDWTNSDDPRAEYNELQYRFYDGFWQALDNVSDSVYTWQDVAEGTYDFRVRAIGLASNSKWVLYNDLEVATTVTGILPPTNLRVYGGGTTWTGRDCHMEWDASLGCYYNGALISGTEMISGYKIEIRKPDTTLLNTYTVDGKTTDFIYTYDMNMVDTSGLPNRTILVYVYTMDVYGYTSPYESESLSNPAPDMSSTLPVVTPRQGYLEIDWAQTSDLDMDKYSIYVGDTNPPASGVGEVAYPVHRFEYFNVLYGTAYYVKIYPYDLFGIGEGSQVPDGETPLLITNIDVDVELQDSVTITSSGITVSGSLDWLYDGDFTASGISFVGGTGEKYIQYYYNIENYFDRISIWAAATWSVYIAHSVDGSTWSYLKGEADHTLDADDKLLVASSQSDASTNYWTTGAAGLVVAMFPNNISAKYIRVYCRSTSSKTVYEIVPARLIISELAAIGSLSAISANIGNITAGVIQSDDYGLSTGFKIDMDDSEVYLGGGTTPVMKFYNDGTPKLDITANVTFRSGTSGYTNISDKPAASDTYNSYNSSNGNIITFPDFEGTNTYASNIIGGWPFSYNSTKPPSGGVNYSTDWRAVNTNTIWWMENGPIGGAETSVYSYVYTNTIAAEAGKRYCFAVYSGAHRCRIDAYLNFFDAAGASLGAGTNTSNDAAQTGGPLLSGYYRHASFGNAPTGTKYIRCYIIKYQTKTGHTSSYAFLCHPLLSEVGANQTIAPAWAAGGTDNSHWEALADMTKIDGGKIYVGSQITLNEGGKAVFGNSNVIIDTAGNHGSIVVAPNGGPTSQSYCHLNDSDILFYYWNGSSHQLYNSMTRIEAGVASANTNVTLPGIWKSSPKIIVSPNTLSCFNASYPNQSQTIRVYSTGPYPTGNTFYFGAYAELQLAAGATGAAGAGSITSSSTDFNTTQINLAANTRRIVVNCTCYGYRWDASTSFYNGTGEYATFAYYANAYKHANYQVILYYYLAGVGWTNVPAWQYSSSTTAGGYAQTKSFTFDTGTQSYNITAYYIRMLTTSYDSAVTNWVNTGSSYVSGGAYFNCNDQGYTSNLVSATALAYGTLNWLAIGR